MAGVRGRTGCVGRESWGDKDRGDFMEIDPGKHHRCKIQRRASKKHLQPVALPEQRTDHRNPQDKIPQPSGLLIVIFMKRNPGSPDPGQAVFEADAGLPSGACP